MLGIWHLNHGPNLFLEYVRDQIADLPTLDTNEGAEYGEQRCLVTSKLVPLQVVNHPEDVNNYASKRCAEKCNLAPALARTSPNIRINQQTIFFF